MLVRTDPIVWAPSRDAEHLMGDFCFVADVTFVSVLSRFGRNTSVSVLHSGGNAATQLVAVRPESARRTEHAAVAELSPERGSGSSKGWHSRSH